MRSKHKIAAKDIQEGDRLDIGGKVRVFGVNVTPKKVFVGYRLRGSRSPGGRIHNPDDEVTVWRERQ